MSKRVPSIGWKKMVNTWIWINVHHLHLHHHHHQQHGNSTVLLLLCLLLLLLLFFLLDHFYIVHFVLQQMLLLITVVNPFGSLYIQHSSVCQRVCLRVYVSRLTCIHCSYASSSLFLFKNSPTLIYSLWKDEFLLLLLPSKKSQKIKKVNLNERTFLRIDWKRFCLCSSPLCPLVFSSLTDISSLCLSLFLLIQCRNERSLSLLSLSVCQSKLL